METCFFQPNGNLFCRTDSAVRLKGPNLLSSSGDRSFKLAQAVPTGRLARTLAAVKEEPASNVAALSSCMSKAENAVESTRTLTMTKFASVRSAYFAAATVTSAGRSTRSAMT